MDISTKTSMSVPPRLRNRAFLFPRIFIQPFRNHAQVDEVAARIREVATDSRVPLVANPPLARALYTVPLEAEIPAEHFKAVAEIVAYVWRLRGRAAG